MFNVNSLTQYNELPRTGGSNHTAVIECSSARVAALVNKVHFRDGQLEVSSSARVNYKSISQPLKYHIIGRAIETNII